MGPLRIVQKIPLDKAYVKTYSRKMGIPKVTKQTDLRDNLYKTLEEVATGGSPHLVPTKNGEVIILSRKEYDKILLEKELLAIDTPELLVRARARYSA